MQTALVTGSSGFIGSYVCRRLLDEGWRVIGVDSMSDYYDVSLKERRQSNLLQSSAFTTINDKIETPGLMMSLFEEHQPDIVIHLAAQAGVRYSIENPRPVGFRTCRSHSPLGRTADFRWNTARRLVLRGG